MKTKDLMIVGLIFGLMINVASNIYKDNRIYKLQKEVLDTKKEYINLFYEDKKYIDVLEQSRDSLNNEIDRLINELQEYKYLEKLKKDIDRSN